MSIIILRQVKVLFAHVDWELHFGAIRISQQLLIAFRRLLLLILLVEGFDVLEVDVDVDIVASVHHLAIIG